MLKQHLTRVLGLLILLTILAGCLPEGVRLPESPLLRTLERKSGLIVYVGLDGNVYTIDQGGGEPTAVTTDAKLQPGGNGDSLKVYQLPAWSPNDRQLAFIGLTGATGNEQEGAVYTAAADGSDLKELYQKDGEIPIYLYWSPDGESVSFLTNLQGGSELLLHQSPVSGEDSRVLDAASPLYWSWAPDSSQLLLHAGGNAADARLSRLAVGEQLVEEVLPYEPLLFQSPQWSPDGRSLLFAGRTEEGDEGLLLLNENGEIRTLLETDADQPVGFSWSPDSGRVAYIRNDTEALQGLVGSLNVLTVDGSQETISTEDELVIAFFWSPDGEEIAYFIPGQVPVSEEENAETVLALSLNVMNVSSGESRQILAFRPSSAFVSAVIPFFDQYQRSATIWSPDSNNLVISALSGEDAIPHLFVVAASGALNPRPIATGILGFWSWE